MGIESDPQLNPQKPREGGPKTPESASDKKDYELRRFGAGWKALAAFDTGMLGLFKEAFLTTEAERSRKEQETGSRGVGVLRTFAEKALQGYQATERAGEILDEAQFQDIVEEYEGRMTDSSTEEERAALDKELEEITSSRDRKLAQETRGRDVRNRILGTFAEILKK